MAFAIAGTVGCTPALVNVRTDCADAGSRLARIWAPLATALADPDACRSGGTADTQAACSRARLDLERLAFTCPNHGPTLMANAVLAYEEGRRIEAQQRLDAVFELSARNPEAAILRAHIALDEGNAPFAKRLLNDQIVLSPDHAGLREVSASVLYLTGDLPGAAAALTLAARLGAPRWRVAYHLGLVEEGLGRLQAARARYDEALAARPGWPPAESRRRALASAEP